MLWAALQRVFDDPESDTITAADLAGPYPVVRYVPPDGSLSVDLLARLGERVAGPLYPPGISRFRSIEEANAAQEAAVVARMRRRHRGPTEAGGSGGAR